VFFDGFLVNLVGFGGIKLAVLKETHPRPPLFLKERGRIRLKLLKSLFRGEFGGKQMIKYLLLILLLLLSSCSPKDQEMIEGDQVTEEVAVSENVSNEAVFTYNSAENSESLPQEIYLMIAGNPVQIYEKGFVKFKGAITPGNCIGLIEIAGHGVVVSKGDEVGKYLVSLITSDYMVLSYPHPLSLSQREREE